MIECVTEDFVAQTFGPGNLTWFEKHPNWDRLERPGITSDPNSPVNDFVSGIQATSLTLIMNPTMLRRIHDNEFRAREAAYVIPTSS